jgi:NhaP-type Na+/H+ or K+/H+ antiporter
VGDAAGVALVLCLLVLFAGTARRLDRMSVTGAMLFTAAGLLLGAEALDLLPATAETEPVKLLAELTLAVILFTDASAVNARAVRDDTSLVGRMLGVGLPLMAVLGAIVAWMLFPGLGWAGAALLAAVVAPTDAALGLAVFNDRAVPARVRRVLNVESGLNDGLATPLVLFFIAVVAAEEVSGSQAVTDAIGNIVVGVGAGCAIGALGALALLVGRRHGATTPHSEDVGVLALAALAFVGAIAVSGNGFVAAFVGGLAFGVVARGRLRERVEVSDVVGVVLALLVWTIFGALLAGPVLAAGIEWRPVAYAVLSLTVLRLSSVAFALAGRGARAPTVAFMGWFGPRGLASVVFTLLVVVELEGVAPAIADEVTATATWTILLSVFLHGLTARPLGRRYGAWVSGLPGGVFERGPAPAGVRRRSHPGNHGRRPPGPPHG